MKHKYLTDLKTTVSDLIVDLKENIFTRSEEANDMFMIEFFFNQMNEQMVMNHCIENILPFAREIKTKNIQFFISQKAKIFGDLPADRVDYFEKLVITPEEKGGMTNENRDILWLYFQTIVNIVELYKKND